MSLIQFHGHWQPKCYTYCGAQVPVCNFFISWICPLELKEKKSKSYSSIQSKPVSQPWPPNSLIFSLSPSPASLDSSLHLSPVHSAECNGGLEAGPASLAVVYAGGATCDTTALLITSFSLFQISCSNQSVRGCYVRTYASRYIWSFYLLFSVSE